MSQDNTKLREQIEETRGRLRECAEELRCVDDELTVLEPRRRQHELLEQACDALEELGSFEAAELFWGASVDQRATEGHLRQVRNRLEGFRAELGAVETRRRGILAAIARTEEDLEILGEDLYDAEQQEIRRKEEWLLEREISPLPKRAVVMPWARGGEDDWRFRKVLAGAVLASLAIGVLLPMIDLPVVKRSDPVVIPERLVELVREERAKPVPPPKPAEAPAEQTPPERMAQKPKPTDEHEPPAPGGPGPEQAQVAARPQQKPAGKPGLLAFRDTFASLAKDDVAPKLGAGARINDADDAAPAQVQRAMLTTNAPGSSGGINLASLSRNVGGGGSGGGGGGGAGALAGVQVGQASSSIGGGGGGGRGASDRPLASGAGATRTDEEIQIVFDRYKAALYRLYNRELRKDPSLRGQMVLRLTIEPDGSVSMCALQSSDMDAPQLSAQVVDRVRGINFGAKDVEAITIVYPIDFLPAA